jgi:hypothetical protein
MKRNRVRASSFLLACGAVVGASPVAWAQGGKPPQYPSRVAVERYLMADRGAEVALARSAGPPGIARDAEVLVLGARGYESAVKGVNGFVCLVERSWMQPYDSPVFWDPTVRLPLCLNPPAARTHLPLVNQQTAMVLAGVAKSEMFERTKAAFEKNELPVPEAGSMCYMLSKQQNFGPKVGNADPHLMFWFPQRDHVTWGAEAPESPVDVHQYSPQPITEFAISVSKWSDGTAAP